MAMTDTLRNTGPAAEAAPKRSHTTLWLLAPGVIWMVLFLALPIAMMIYISFWTQTTFTIKSDLTTANWINFFTSPTYLDSLWTTVRIWITVLLTTLVVPGELPDDAPPHLLRALLLLSAGALISLLAEHLHRNRKEANRRLEAMMRLALRQPGCLGAESVRDETGLGITVSYFTDEASLVAWKKDARHLVAQRAGRERWYSHYKLRVAKVERDYAGPEGR